MYIVYMTGDTWHVTHGEGEYFLKISAPYLSRFGGYSALKKLPQRVSEWVNELISNEGVWRTVPAGFMSLLFKH